MLARTYSRVLAFSLVVLAVFLGGCCWSSRCCPREGSGGSGEGDLLLRGHGVFVEIPAAAQYDLRLYLYGIDSLARPAGTLMQLQNVEIFGKSGDVPATNLGGTDTLLGTAKPFDGSHVALGGPRRQAWEAKPEILDAKRMKVDKAGKPVFSVLARFHFAVSSPVGVVTERLEERYARIRFVKSSPSMNLQVAPAGGGAGGAGGAITEGDAITKLMACATFHPPQSQAIFDLTDLAFTGTAGRIEIFAAPPDGTDLYTEAHRIHYHLGATGSPYAVSGLVGPYDGSNTWRFGARVTVAGVASVKEGLFIDLVNNPGTVTPVGD